MEVVSYISIGAVATIVISALVSVFQNWFSSPPVQQVVIMAMMIRDSLPPMLVNVGAAALVLLKRGFLGLVEFIAAMPPVVVETIKYILLAVVQALHLIVHIGYQVALFAKNIYDVVIVAGKSIFVVIRSINDGFAFVWNFSENILEPLTNWMFTHPVRTANWHTVMIVLMISLCLSMARRYIAYKTKIKQN